RSLTATCCCTLPGSPRERNAWTTSGIPPRAVKVSSSGLGSTSNSNGDSVGEGFCIRRMPAIVRESRTWRVRIPEHTPSLVVAAFMLYPWAQTPASPATGPPHVLVIDGSGLVIHLALDGVKWKVNENPNRFTRTL